MDLRSIFIDNLGVKAVSFAVAVALAIFVRGEKTALGNFRLKVNYLLDDGRILTSTQQNEVTLRLKGPESLVNQLREDQLPPLIIDLNQQQSGQYCFEFQPGSLPTGFQSLSIDELLPRCVPLKLEPRVEKEVPVVADVVGTPEAGYSLGNISADPPKVVVYGAESAVRALQQVRTEPLSIAQSTGTRREDVTLFPLPDTSFVWFKEGPSPRVSVQVEILPQKVEKILRDVKIVSVPPLLDPDSFGLLPESLDLVVYGPKPVLDAIKPADISVSLDLSAALPAVTSKTPVTLTVDPAQVRGLPPEVLPVNFRPGPEVKLYSRK